MTSSAEGGGRVKKGAVATRASGAEGCDADGFFSSVGIDLEEETETLKKSESNQRKLKGN
jgi:hypothetical protein